MSSFGIEGNIIDCSWYQIIRWKITEKNPKGKPHLEAINLLADIFYWYKPKKNRNLDNANVVLEKKFHDDILQRSYGQIEEMMGLTKDEARSALETLEKLSLIKREFRTITVRDMKIANVMFIRFYPIKLKDLMDEYFKNSIPSSFQTDDPIGSNPLPPPFKPMTNTETSSEIFPQQQHVEPSAVVVSSEIQELLRPYPIPKEKILEFANIPIEELRSRILAFEQYKEKKRNIDNPMGCLISAIVESWKPSEKICQEKKQQQEQKQRSETLDSNRRIATDLEKEYNSEFTRYCNFEIKDNLLWIKSENKLNPLDLSDIESIKMLRSFINKNFKKEK